MSKIQGTISAEALLSILEKRAADLNQATDRANKAIAEVEQRLVGLQIGLEYWHPSPLTSALKEGKFGKYDTTSRSVHLMGYAKVDGDWRLAVRRMKIVEGFYQGDTDCPFREELADGEAAPLSKASRDIRTSAVAMLPQFVEGLTEHVESAITAVNSATADV